jgi:hypothetical protein
VSDEAIQKPFSRGWIASLALAMTMLIFVIAGYFRPSTPFPVSKTWKPATSAGMTGRTA